MTVASALNALNTDIQKARTAITNKGGTVTTNGGSSQLATDIATIPSGGSADVEEALHRINSGDIHERIISFDFHDLNGTVIGHTFEIFIDNEQIYNGIPENYKKIYYITEFGKSHSLDIKVGYNDLSQVYLNGNYLGEFLYDTNNDSFHFRYNFTVSKDLYFEIEDEIM